MVRKSAFTTCKILYGNGCVQGMTKRDLNSLIKRKHKRKSTRRKSSVRGSVKKTNPIRVPEYTAPRIPTYTGPKMPQYTPPPPKYETLFPNKSVNLPKVPEFTPPKSASAPLAIEWTPAKKEDEKLAKEDIKEAEDLITAAAKQNDVKTAEAMITKAVDLTADAVNDAPAETKSTFQRLKDWATWGLSIFKKFITHPVIITALGMGTVVGLCYYAPDQAQKLYEYLYETYFPANMSSSANAAQIAADPYVIDLSRGIPTNVTLLKTIRGPFVRQTDFDFSFKKVKSINKRLTSRRSPKRRSPKRRSPKRRSPKRRSPKRRSPMRRY